MRTGMLAPGASSSGSGMKLGVTASVAELPSRASRTSASVSSASPRSTRVTSFSTVTFPVLVSVPVSVSESGPSAVTTRGDMSVRSSRSGPRPSAEGGVAGAAAAVAVIGPANRPVSSITMIAATAATGFTPSPP